MPCPSVLMARSMLVPIYNKTDESLFWLIKNCHYLLDIATHSSTLENVLKNKTARKELRYVCIFRRSGSHRGQKKNKKKTRTMFMKLNT